MCIKTEYNYNRKSALYLNTCLIFKEIISFLRENYIRKSNDLFVVSC